MQKIIVWGNSDYAKRMSLYLSEIYEIVAYCVDPEYKDSDEFLGLPLFTYDQVLQRYAPDDYNFFIAVGYNQNLTVKQQCFLRVKSDGYKCVSYVHPSAIVSSHAEIGENVFVMESAIVSPYSKIGNCVTLCAQSLVCHDVNICDYCFLGAKSCVNGFTTVQNNTFVGAGAIIRDHIEIGAYNIIGAGCCVLENTADYFVCKAPVNITLNIDSRHLTI